MTDQPDSSGICDVPPLGWYCTREPGHEPPCAAWPSKRYTRAERFHAEVVHLVYVTGLRTYCHDCDLLVWGWHRRRCPGRRAKAAFLAAHGAEIAAAVARASGVAGMEQTQP